MSMSNNYKQCPRGHYYKGDTCPYCPTQYYTVNEVNSFDGVGDLQQHISELMTIPICAHCGRPLRRGIPRPEHGLVVSSLYDIRDRIIPWNYQWDGRCENCGHDYNVVMNINMGSNGPDHKMRQTIVKVASRGFCHDVESCLGEISSTELSGVEIETRCGDQVQTLFLSANELKHLMRVLQNSPVLRQFDYYVEDYDKSKYRT